MNSVKSVVAGHLLPLDALRGIAALVVVLGHIGWVTSISGTPFFFNSYLMVDFFFVLSGFVMALNYASRIEAPSKLGRFIWARFWRLYPMHFLALMVFVAIECMRWYMMHRGMVLAQRAFAINNGTALWSNLTLTQSFGMNADNTFNTPAWSISTEFYAYFVFGVAVLVFQTRLFAVAGAIVLFTGYFVWRDGGNLKHTHEILAFNRCLFGFFLGVLIFRLYAAVGKVQALWPLLGALFFLAIFAALVATKRDYRWDWIAPFLSCGIVFFLSVSGLNVLTRLLSSRPMVWIGAISYSIYMVHLTIVWTLTQFVHYVLHAQPVSAAVDPSQPLSVGLMRGNLLLLATVAMTLLLAHFTFRYVEAPLRDWSKSAWPAK